MTITEKLKQAAELMASAYYDLEPCENVNGMTKRELGIAEDLLANVINYLNSKA